MKTNVGGWDRNLRLALGGFAMAAALFGTRRSSWRVPLAIFGASELITAVTRYCPLNQAFGIDTRRRGEKAADQMEAVAEEAEIST